MEERESSAAGHTVATECRNAICPSTNEKAAAAYTTRGRIYSSCAWSIRWAISGELPTRKLTCRNHLAPLALRRRDRRGRKRCDRFVTGR